MIRLDLAGLTLWAIPRFHRIVESTQPDGAYDAPEQPRQEDEDFTIRRLPTQHQRPSNSRSYRTDIALGNALNPAMPDRHAADHEYAASQLAGHLARQTYR